MQALPVLEATQDASAATDGLGLEQGVMGNNTALNLGGFPKAVDSVSTALGKGFVALSIFLGSTEALYSRACCLWRLGVGLNSIPA